ncbi:carboxypeptidase-like regulatory domain-containing protein [Hymenobacter sp. BT175]|uniref:carboxypeptidase-like regulatory domain-containing protein n=1 Tax=Hymenobacter translucens TaxID=2886507 RepID=UPI001D0E7528|nr:carboxypeptidase-like regulatory domain-containing protein [Hymenobacter translucens]MCC2546095.1 carboxypeptidase-like regulatory domain-containing protein [Hymenobacter translucens]
MITRLLLVVSLVGLLATAGRAQNAPDNRMTGRVLDQKTKEPIPFTSLGLKDEQVGVLTNEFGFFQIDPPQKNDTDSLVIFALGYERKAILVRKTDGKKEFVIEVPKRVFQLEEVKVQGGKVKDLSLGARTKNPGEGMIQGQAGSQYAFFVKNDKKKKLGNVRSVSFYIGENGFPREPFRVRLYKPDGNYNAPNTDLLTENVVVSAPRGGEWFTVDLTPYNIPAPDEGFYVAMEWIVAGDKFYTTNFSDTYTAYGQIMRPTFEFKESRTWTYTIGKGWNLLTLANGQGQRYNAMIKAEVDMIK